MTNVICLTISLNTDALHTIISAEIHVAKSPYLVTTKKEQSHGYSRKHTFETTRIFIRNNFLNNIRLKLAKNKQNLSNTLKLFKNIPRKKNCLF